jgi:hypothetical protein
MAVHVGGTGLADRVGKAHRCLGCGKELDPSAADVVHAVELRRFESLGLRIDPVGPARTFHESCFPYGSPRYRIERKPDL